MDLSATIVVVVMTAMSLAAIVGLEIYSRKTRPKDVSVDQVDGGANDHPG